MVNTPNFILTIKIYSSNLALQTKQTMLSIYNDLLSLGLKVIPIEWDAATKQPVSHRFWQQEDTPLLPKHNALMIRTEGEYGCIDFDLKNTQRKDLYSQWMTIITNEWPNILSKVYIEETRNKGYHIWFRYNALPKKQQLAGSEDGHEVIALYCNGPLVYTYPTPGYTQVHQSMEDCEPLTQDEYNYLIEVSQYFNEYKPKYDPTRKAVNYPAGYEEELLNYDTNITDDGFATLLDMIGLEPCTRTKETKFEAWRRKGSESKGISAKVYFKSKRLLLFTASLNHFPNWHNKEEYPSWALPPSFILFYHLNRDWDAVLQHIGVVKKCEGFPLHVFPKVLADSIIDVSKERSLAPQFLATACIWTISSLAGTRYKSDLNGQGKCIVFALMSGPVSVGKTPAMEIASKAPLKEMYASYDNEYAKRLKAWEAATIEAKATKKAFTQPRPKRYLPFMEDNTTEGYISKLTVQKNGLGVYHDEAESILGAGNYKGTNNSVTFWTQAFSGGRYVQGRANEENERVVANMNMNLLMGTQPSRLKNIFTEDALAQGFASRFLIVDSDYIELNENVDPFSEKRELCNYWKAIVVNLFDLGDKFNSGEIGECDIVMKHEAKQHYTKLYQSIIRDANKRIQTKAEQYVIGTEAKMSAYFGRFCVILSIIENYQHPEITTDIINKAYELYRYYADNTIKVIASLHEEIETTLPADLRLLYEALPNEFDAKEAAATCERLNLKKRRFELAMRSKAFSSLFVKLGRGKWGK